MQYFKCFTDYLDKHDMEHPVGCSMDEITELESALGSSLPQVYKDYLLLMGKDYDGVMVGTGCFLSDVESNNEYLPKLLEENNLREFVLPEKYVAFFCHQGYMMAWFSIPSSESDPLCTYFFEGTTAKPEVYGTFSEFMEKDLMGNAQLRVENRHYEREQRKWWQFWK
jgi:hypothetical protein